MNIAALSSSAPMGMPNNYKYNGKELNEEFDLNWYSYGAREYDAQLGRFFTQDRYAEKYYDMNPYQYAGNDPIRNIDVNGDSINVAGMLKYDKDNGTNHFQTLLGDLTSQTGLSFKVENNKLVFDTDDNGNAKVSTDSNGNEEGSAEARDIMTDAISDQDNMVFARFNTKKNSKAPIGGNLIDINPDQVSKFIKGSKNLDSRTMGFGMTFMHETLHSAAGMSLPDKNGFGQTGAVVDRMNKVRGELNAQGGNYGKRMSYKGLFFKSNIRTNYIPFGVSSYLLMKSAIPPVRENKFIKFTK